MIDWQVKHAICGLAELDAHRDRGVTHLLSILDPDTPEPSVLGVPPPRERLTLYFHDALVPHPNHVLPTRDDLAAILAFGRTLPEGDPAHLLVHCHMGISRSVAAVAAILAQAHPEEGEDAIMAHLQAIRRKAWPNSLMIAHADSLLGREGRLTKAAARLYRRQLEMNPHFAEPLRNSGRAAEVEMAERA